MMYSKSYRFSATAFRTISDTSASKSIATPRNTHPYSQHFHLATFGSSDHGSAPGLKDSAADTLEFIRDQFNSSLSFLNDR
jgi:hypothetical protein